MNDTTQFAQLAASRLHVFVDFSNFFVSLISMCRPETKLGPTLWRTLFPALMRIITNGRLADSRIFVGSIPPTQEEIWHWARDAGFQVCLFPRAAVPSTDGDAGPDAAKAWPKSGGADHHYEREHKPWKLKYGAQGYVYRR